MGCYLNSKANSSKAAKQTMLISSQHHKGCNTLTTSITCINAHAQGAQLSNVMVHFDCASVPNMAKQQPRYI
jgi:hypothetical protein